MNIVILLGGLSTERKVSIISGEQVASALIRLGHNVAVLDLSKNYVTSDVIEYFTTDKNLIKAIIDNAKKGNYNKKEIGDGILEICKYADLVFNALHGGIGENGKIQSLLDIHDIKYTATGSEGSFIAMNKWLTKLVMSSKGISTPSGFLLTKNIFLNDIKKYPLFLKPNNGGSSINTFKIKSKEELNEKIEMINLDEDYLLEEFIKGRELSVGILGDKVLPIMEIETKNEFFDYKSKYEIGESKEFFPDNLSEEIKNELNKAAMKLHKTLKLKYYSRIDFILTEENKIYCLEVNTVPGMTLNSIFPQMARKIDIDFDELCELIIYNA